MADQRRGEQLCEHLLSRQVRRSGGAGKPAFAGSDLREDGDVWPSRRPPSRSSCMLPGSKGRAQSKVFERLQTSATLRGSKKTTRRTWSCVLRKLGGRHGRGFDRGAAPNLVLSVRAIFNRSNRKLCVPFLGPGSGPQRTPRREVPAKRLVLSCPCERRRPQQRGRPMARAGCQNGRSSHRSSVISGFSRGLIL